MFDLLVALLLPLEDPSGPEYVDLCYDAETNPDGYPCLPRIYPPDDFVPVEDVIEPPAVDEPPTPWNIPGLPAEVLVVDVPATDQLTGKWLSKG
jgi:hypothetical protein